MGWGWGVYSAKLMIGFSSRWKSIRINTGFGKGTNDKMICTKMRGHVSR